MFRMFRFVSQSTDSRKHSTASKAYLAEHPLSKRVVVGSNATGGFCEFSLGQYLRAGLHCCNCFVSQPRRRHMLIVQAFDIAERGFDPRTFGF